ncbi:class III lanthionine synthetase LanKC N-terminal domain-containing protein [Streptomyces rimosus]
MRSRRVTHVLNRKYVSRAASGKVVTLYPRDTEDSCALPSLNSMRHLAAAPVRTPLRGFAVQGGAARDRKQGREYASQTSQKSTSHCFCGSRRGSGRGCRRDSPGPGW